MGGQAPRAHLVGAWGCRGWNWGPVGRGTPARPQGVLHPLGAAQALQAQAGLAALCLVWWLRLRGPHCFRASPVPLPPAPGVRTPSVALNLCFNSGSSLPQGFPSVASVGKAIGEGAEWADCGPAPPWEIRARRYSGAQGPLPLSEGSGRGPCVWPSRCSVALVSWVFPGETRLSQGLSGEARHFSGSGQAWVLGTVLCPQGHHCPEGSCWPRSLWRDPAASRPVPHPSTPVPRPLPLCPPSLSPHPPSPLSPVPLPSLPPSPSPLSPVSPPPPSPSRPLPRPFISLLHPSLSPVPAPSPTLSPVYLSSCPPSRPFPSVPPSPPVPRPPSHQPPSLSHLSLSLCLPVCLSLCPVHLGPPLGAVLLPLRHQVPEGLCCLMAPLDPGLSLGAWGADPVNPGSALVFTSGSPGAGGPGERCPLRLPHAQRVSPPGPESCAASAARFTAARQPPASTHHCEPNLVPVRVFMSHQDLRSRGSPSSFPA